MNTLDTYLESRKVLYDGVIADLELQLHFIDVAIEVLKFYKEFAVKMTVSAHTSSVK